MKEAPVGAWFPTFACLLHLQVGIAVPVLDQPNYLPDSLRIPALNFLVGMPRMAKVLAVVQRVILKQLVNSLRAFEVICPGGTNLLDLLVSEIKLSSVYSQ